MRPPLAHDIVCVDVDAVWYRFLDGPIGGRVFAEVCEKASNATTWPDAVVLSVFVVSIIGVFPLLVWLSKGKRR